jgi:hypothetical protein
VGEGRKVYKVLVGKPEGKRQFEDRGVDGDGIRLDLMETGFWGVKWIHLAQDRDRWRAVVNAVMNLPVLAPWAQSVMAVAAQQVTVHWK